MMQAAIRLTLWFISALAVAGADATATAAEFSSPQDIVIGRNLRGTRETTGVVPTLPPTQGDTVPTQTPKLTPTGAVPSPPEAVFRYGGTNLRGEDIWYAAFSPEPALVRRNPDVATEAKLVM